jgi:exodeoxyribonuclease VII small subunit
MTTTKIKTSPAPKDSGLSDLAFGEAMDRLDAIVAQLEGDATLELEQAMGLYEQGVALAAACRGRLAHAELRLTEIVVQAPPDEANG